MAITENTYTGNGSTQNFSFTFPYISESDVKVSLNDVDQPTTAYSFANATTISFNTAPALGVAIRIYRQTAQNTPPATFFAGSAIRAQDLNENFLQQLYIAQETANIANDLTTGGIAPGSITNNLLADNSVNSAKIVDGAIVNADISATAEIAVSKLADGSARQLLQTDAAGTGVEWTSNVDVPGTLDVTGAATFDSSVVVTGAATFGSTVTVPSLNGGPLAGARNRIINGSLDFWQRGTSTTATGNTYMADRWQSAFATGGTVSQETTSLPAGSRYAWKFVASASNSFMQMGQQIEYFNCLDLQNATVTISFMARSVNSNAGSTALTVRTRTIAGIDGSCIFAGSNADSSVTLTTTWTRYTVTRTLPATFGSLSLEFALGSHVSGDGIMLSQIQLEPGTVATPFERRSYGQELSLCQRYYEIGQFQLNTSVSTGGITTGTTLNYATRKRANSPNVALSSIVYNNNSNALVPASYPNGFVVTSQSSGGPGASILRANWTSSAEL